MTDDDRERVLSMLRDALAAEGLPGAEVERLLGDVRFADRWPAFADLLAGPDGTVWVQRVAPPAELRPQRDGFGVDVGSRTWDVVDADGHLLGPVEMPPRFDPFIFADDRLYGVARDAMDVPRVVVLRLGRDRAG